jgi:Xaa-Pro aminopeptidase
MSIVGEKLEQAVGLLEEMGIDAWLTFVRETQLTPDPCMDLIVGMDMTWHSAFLVGRSGERVAIVGRYDAETVAGIGAYGEVVPYDESIRPMLVEAIERINPKLIAINYSEGDPAADGLTHGMYLYLRDTLMGTPYVERLVSAEGLISALRGRKSASEVGLIRAAIATTEEMYAELGRGLKVGQTEREIGEKMHEMRRARGLGTAWDEVYCPTIHAGPDSVVGHTPPGDYRTQRGQLLHMDFGVKQEGFCSDLQRMWYFLEEGESEPPEDVRRAWDACWGAIDAAAAVLKPGAVGWEVDRASREYLVGQGYPEYRHAVGHHLGRAVHDGSTLLGPRWDRYGETPYGVVEAGNVFTLELGVAVAGRGYIGLEEDVLVTGSGIEWLSRAQRELWLVGG